jgi:tRNA(Ile)-lysidine synthase
MSNLVSIESEFLGFLRSYCTTNKRSEPPSGGILIAFSGGLDSTALLHLAVATAHGHGRAITVGHVNHGVRADAFAEETRLRALCGDLGIGFRCVRLGPGGGGAQRAGAASGAANAPRGLSEDAMRRARAKALRRLAAEAGCEWVLLGHQRDDQAETLLLNLLRGAGLRGLAGMPPRRGIFLRPLLAHSREMLRRYLEQRGAIWVEDPTNADPAIARNRIRHRVLPLLEAEMQPRAREALARAAGNLQRALAALDADAEICLAACALPSTPGDIRLDPARLRSYHPGLVEFTLRLAIARIRGSAADLPAPLLRGIAAHCLDGRAGRFRVAGGTIVDVTDRSIRIARETPPSGGGFSGPVPIPLVGTIRWGSGRFRTRTIEWAEGSRLRVRGLERVQVFDAGEIRPPMLARVPAEGDRLLMEDGKGSRLLSDLLSERGVPRDLRADQPILEDAGGVLWAPGIRRAARALVGTRTRRIWIVRWQGRLPSEDAPIGGDSRR